MKSIGTDDREEDGMYYCKECNKLFRSCYELDGVIMCPKCWSDVVFISAAKLTSFIRKKRLEKINKSE